MNRIPTALVTLFAAALVAIPLFSAPTARAEDTRRLAVAVTTVAVSAGADARVRVSGGSGTIGATSADPAIASATYARGVATIHGVAAGKTTVTVADSRTRFAISVSVTGGSSPPPPPPTATTTAPGPWKVFAANDLGMHCSDQDFQVFSILPPFNVIHAQVVVPGTATAKPRLLSDTEADVSYVATSSADDPIVASSINTTSANSPAAFKSNFWQSTTLPSGATGQLGVLGYKPLYPGADKIGACNPASGPCPSVLELFAPLPTDLGLPVPDPAKLPALAAAQATMPSVVSTSPYTVSPYAANLPQKFARYDANLPFFAAFPFGTIVNAANWFSSDGIPILPIDDAGNRNPYPLMRVQATAKGADPKVAANLRGRVDIVVPVSSEADCRNCHADPSDHGNGRASSFASVTAYAGGNAWPIARAADAPGPEKLNNASKINILRLHDAKHGSKYTSSATGAATPCTNGTEAACLDRRRAIQCSQCHYSPALDLAQAGPVDETTQGAHGRQQTKHVSMSRAMHFNHGQHTDLFPAMPAPKTAARTPAKQAEVLQATCYQCHPGKETQCLRGAMATAGVTCHDCHGDMKQVGNDFTAGFPAHAGADLAKRVPWAMEPKCQSCHIGDAVSVQAINRSDMIVAADNIRLLQAYTKSNQTASVLPMIASPASRFAENQKLYRLSKGHGGVACQACHGSTHAEWPNANPKANDNVAAVQLQGHAGTIIECNVCHAAGSLKATLGGPHGMHPVDANWVLKHEDVAENNRNACRACHGQRGEGTVLARMAATRTLPRDDDGRRTITLTKGTMVRCDTCHENKL
ncbi:MAG: hypothetical protein U1F51_15090 [Burkholderiales bacterium]